MSDFDNLREAAFEKRQELDNEARDATIDMHAANWINAVTKSPEQSRGTFASVIDYEASKQRHSGYVYRKPTSADVFVERMVEGDFMERAAQILIDLHSVLGGLENSPIRKLFDDMAANYAEFQYESQIKD
jgi:hypothetical protein